MIIRKSQIQKALDKAEERGRSKATKAKNEEIANIKEMHQLKVFKLKAEIKKRDRKILRDEMYIESAIEISKLTNELEGNFFKMQFDIILQYVTKVKALAITVLRKDK